MNDAIARLYRQLQKPTLGLDEARSLVGALGLHVARDVKQAGLSDGRDDRVLLVTILRGGLLLYPSFVEAFPSAAIGLVQVRRVGDDERAIVYEMFPSLRCAVVLYLDTVVGSGKTIEKVVGRVRQIQPNATHCVCVISSASVGTAKLASLGLRVFGISTDEHLRDGLVLPDLGERDAGDLASGIMPDPADATPFPIVSFESAHVAGSEAAMVRQTLIYQPIVELVQELQPRAILDLGCGAGELTRLLAPHAEETTGYDDSLAAIQMARETTRLPTVHFSSVVTSAMDGRFDFIACCMVLNSTPDASGVMLTARRCAAPGGVQAWVILHPAFQFNESQWRARKLIAETGGLFSYEAVPSYFDEHSFTKTVGDAAVVEHHRPLSAYFDLFIRHGFAIRAVKEPRLMGTTQFSSDRVTPKTLIIVTEVLAEEEVAR